MSHQIGVRLNDAEYQGVQAACRRYGKSAAEVIRYFVDVCLQNPPGQQPAPQPAPPPGAPQDALKKRLRELGALLDRLNTPCNWAAFNLWWPKVLAILAASLAFVAFWERNGLAAFMLLPAMIFFSILDGYWKGRILRNEILERTWAELADLIEEAPVLYKQLCLSKPPDLAAAEVLAHIDERFELLGATGIHDIVLNEWQVPK